MPSGPVKVRRPLWGSHHRPRARLRHLAALSLPRVPPPPALTMRWVALGYAHHARALAVADLRVEPGQRSEHPAQAGHPDTAHVGKAGVAGHGSEQVLLDLPAARPQQEPVRCSYSSTASAPPTLRPPGRRPGTPAWGKPQVGFSPGRGGSSGSGSKLTLLPWGSEPSWCAAEATWLTGTFSIKLQKPGA